MLAPWKKSYDQPRQHIKRQRHYFGNKGLSSQSYGFSSSHVWTWELDHKESWVPKNWCFWTVVWRRFLRVPWTARTLSQSILEKISPLYSFGRTDAEAETPVLWPPDAKNWFIGKDPDAGKDWRQEKGMTESEMIGWCHRLNEHEFEQALGVSNGQVRLACCNPWGHKELDMTAWLNWTKPYDLFPLDF